MMFHLITIILSAQDEESREALRNKNRELNMYMQQLQEEQTKAKQLADSVDSLRRGWFPKSMIVL